MLPRSKPSLKNHGQLDGEYSTAPMSVPRPCGRRTVRWSMKALPPASGTPMTGIVARLVRVKYLARAVDKEDRRVARFSLTARGKQIDREKRGTVEAAVRRALGRASDAQATQTIGLIALVVEELARDGEP